MSVAPVPLSAAPSAPGVRLSPYAVAVPALSSHIRPALVLGEQETRDLLDAARRADVTAGGRFSAGLAGIQIWDRPFDGAGRTHGSAVHLGSVDWSYDTPVRGYATVYRAIVTAAGEAAGVTPQDVLHAVLDLVGLTLGGSQVTLPAPPPRDPFRSGRLAS